MGAIGADGVTMDAIGRHVLVALVTTTAENEKSVLIGTTAPMLDGGEVCCPYVASVAEMFYKVGTQAHPKKKNTKPFPPETHTSYPELHFIVC